MASVQIIFSDGSTAVWDYGSDKRLETVYARTFEILGQPSNLKD